MPVLSFARFQWLLDHVAPAVAVGLAVALALLLLHHSLLRWLEQMAERARTPLDEVLLDALRTPSVLWCVALGLMAGLEAALAEAAGSCPGGHHFLLPENQVRVGDVAVIGGTGGYVEAISLRTITLRDMSGSVHIIPNGNVDRVTNMTRDFSYYVSDIGVAYREDTDEVRAVMQGVADELQKDSGFGPDILEPFEMIGVDKFNDSAVIIKCRIKTRPIKQWRVGREFNRRLKKAFDAHGIEIPFPPEATGSR
jgi:hypothetical protein